MGPSHLLKQSNSLLEIKTELISPPKIKGRVNPFTKTNMALWFPTLIAQRNRRESGAPFHAEQLNRQNN
jgi:hypothetical protein